MDWRGPKVVIVVVMATPLFGSSGSSVWTGITYRPLRGAGRGESCCLGLIGWTIIHGLHLDDAAKGYYMQCWQCMGLFDV